MHRTKQESPMLLLRSKTFALALVATGFISHTQAADVTASAFTNGGSTSVSPGACYRMTSAFGQPAQNYTSGGKYQIQTGLLAVVKTDAIFHGTFEVCS
jgi:hypothetical protein